MDATIEINLQPFCRPEEEPTKWHGTYYPWYADGWNYATDGRIIVRLRASEGPAPRGLVPDKFIAKLPWGADGDWRALPPISNLERLATCEYCNGPELVQVDGAAFAAGYLNRLSRLPSFQYMLAKWEDGQLMHFRFEGGGGMLLSLVERP